MFENWANTRRLKNEVRRDRLLSDSAETEGFVAVGTTGGTTTLPMFSGGDRREAFFSIVEMPDDKWRSLSEVLVKDSVFASFSALAGLARGVLALIRPGKAFGLDLCSGCQCVVFRTAFG